MSIIYNALQKTQKSLLAKKKPEPTITVKPAEFDKASRLDYLLLAFAGLLVFAALISLPKQYGVHYQPKVLTSNVSIKPKSLIVNGIFLSKGNKLAVINQKTMHLGDSIGGMKLVSINLNTVRLQNGQSSVVLPTSS